MKSQFLTRNHWVLMIINKDSTHVLFPAIAFTRHTPLKISSKLSWPIFTSILALDQMRTRNATLPDTSWKTKRRSNFRLRWSSTWSARTGSLKRKTSNRLLKCNSICWPKKVRLITFSSLTLTNLSKMRKSSQKTTNFFQKSREPKPTIPIKNSKKKMTALRVIHHQRQIRSSQKCPKSQSSISSNLRNNWQERKEWTILSTTLRISSISKLLNEAIRIRKVISPWY